MPIVSTYHTAFTGLGVIIGLQQQDSPVLSCRYECLSIDFFLVETTVHHREGSYMYLTQLHLRSIHGMLFLDTRARKRLAIGRRHHHRHTRARAEEPCASRAPFPHTRTPPPTRALVHQV